MDVLHDYPLRRAQAKCTELEQQLKRSPDFHLYLLTKSRPDRRRMERILMNIPSFRLWRTLRDSVEHARSTQSATQPSRADAEIAVPGAARTRPHAGAHLHDKKNAVRQRAIVIERENDGTDLANGVLQRADDTQALHIANCNQLPSEAG